MGLTLYRLYSEDKWKTAIAKYGNKLDRLQDFLELDDPARKRGQNLYSHIEPIYLKVGRI